MHFRSGWHDREPEITALFRETFTVSEGDAEGRQIGDFVEALFTTTPHDDLRVFTAHEGDVLSGAIVFSRMRYDADPRRVFVLSPVAVRTDVQKTGIGRRLISHGLDRLRDEGADHAFTYGDPAYYAKMGFKPVTEHFAAAPLPLTMPHGWLGQTLRGGKPEHFTGKPTCVPALDNPALW